MRVALVVLEDFKGGVVHLLDAGYVALAAGTMPPAVEEERDEAGGVDAEGGAGSVEAIVGADFAEDAQIDEEFHGG